MEEQRDQQSSPLPPAAYAQQPGVGYGEVAAQIPPPAPSFLQQDTLSRLLRLLLRRILYGLLLIGRLIRPRLGWVLLVTALLAMIGLESILLAAPLLVRTAKADSRVALMPPSTSVESFLEAQARYDADVMWDAFSPQFQALLAERGLSKDDFVAQAENERAGGQRYRKFAYIGGVALADSRKMYFYAVDIESSQPERNGTFSFIFTVDKDGKIVGLRM